MHPAAAALSVSAPAGQPGDAYFGKAPWEKAGYVHPSLRTILIPDGKDKFHHRVSTNVRVDPYSNGYRGYLGTQMNKAFIENLEYAINKCIRHSEYLEVSPAGFCYLTDVGYIIWKHPQLYHHIFRNHRPAEEEMMFAVEVS